MLSVEFGGKSVTDMSLQYMTKGDPPSYPARRAHEYMPNEQSHTNNIESKTQQHSINDILNSSNKQGKSLDVAFVVFFVFNK